MRVSSKQGCRKRSELVSHVLSHVFSFGNIMLSDQRNSIIIGFCLIFHSKFNGSSIEVWHGSEVRLIDSSEPREMKRQLTNHAQIFSETEYDMRISSVSISVNVCFGKHAKIHGTQTLDMSPVGKMPEVPLARIKSSGIMDG